MVDDLVMTMDMGASVLSMMDVQIPNHFQGQAFLGKQKEPYREYVCGARDRLDNCNEVIRTIRRRAISLHSQLFASSPLCFVLARWRFLCDATRTRNT